MSRYILITGACGGIGSVLTSDLVQSGNKVLAIDDLSSGDWSNIPDHELVEKKTMDILSDDFAELPWDEFTHIIHLAAISSLPECQTNPQKAFDINFGGTVKTATLALKSRNLSCFINASTSAIYESNKDLPFAEDDSVRPHLVYSQSKFFAENYLEALRVDHSFPSISLRFFNVFGPMQSYARKSPPLLNYLVRMAFLNETPTLHSDGHQARDYIDVKDICNAIEYSLDIGHIDESAIFNLSSGQVMTVNEIVDLVSEALNLKIDPLYRSSERLWEGYPSLSQGKYPLNSDVVKAETEKVSVGNSEKFQKLTGWSPSSNQKQKLKLRAKEAYSHILKMESDRVE